jgi:hypothetical protein
MNSYGWNNNEKRHDSITIRRGCFEFWGRVDLSGNVTKICADKFDGRYCKRGILLSSKTLGKVRHYLEKQYQTFIGAR